MHVRNDIQSAQFPESTQPISNVREFTRSANLAIKDIPPSKNNETAPNSGPDLKEMATEMLPKERRMGEFKDKNWVEEAKDLQIGPDIRFAVKSKNPDFLKRIVWGPLTAAEFREVTHRIRELELKLDAESNNIFKGRIIDLDA